jgi:hypothetical protein
LDKKHVRIDEKIVSKATYRDAVNNQRYQEPAISMSRAN